MRPVPCTHILFDFFGTLVDYSPSRTSQAYPRSHRLLRGFGGAAGYQDFLDGWARTMAEFDRRCDCDDHEYAMNDVSAEYLVAALGREPTRTEIEELAAAYVAEWSSTVRYPDGIAEFLRGLSREYRLAVVTNTYQPDLVPGHLAAMGVADCFDTVVTSVEVGWRKPHPKIYETALGALDVEPRAAVFVGDTLECDYRGPTGAGMRAFLIDPGRLAPVPDDARIGSVFDLPHRLRQAG